jgi:hypothetical protein
MLTEVRAYGFKTKASLKLLNQDVDTETALNKDFGLPGGFVKLLGYGFYRYSIRRSRSRTVLLLESLMFPVLMYVVRLNDKRLPNILLVSHV